MIAVVQRVSQADVTVAHETVGEIGPGLLVLLGVKVGDDEQDASTLADKIVQLRIFEDENGKMNRCLAELGLALLLVSQFTLCADLRKGRRPGFDAAERPERARALLDVFAKHVEAHGLVVKHGRFGASMSVRLINEGPATFLLDSALWRG